MVNRRNTRYIADSPQNVHPSIKYVARSTMPAKVMMLGIICNDGKVLLPIWIDDNLVPWTPPTERATGFGPKTEPLRTPVSSSRTT